MDDRLRRMRIAMLAVVAVMAMPGAAQPAPRETDADALATALVARMTLEEKLPQLLNTAPAIPRLDVPAYNWWTESLHGALGTAGQSDRRSEQPVVGPDEHPVATRDFDGDCTTCGRDTRIDDREHHPGRARRVGRRTVRVRRENR